MSRVTATPGQVFRQHQVPGHQDDPPPPACCTLHDVRRRRGRTHDTQRACQGSRRDVALQR